jgi:predicted nucleic acid-binding protein
MPRSLKDFHGEAAVFIDANIFLHHAFGSNDASMEFLKRVETENIRAYTSALVMEEVAFKLVMQSASNFVEKINLDKLKRYLTDSGNRGKALGPVKKYMGYIQVLRDMGLKIVDLTGGDITVAIEKAATNGLITADGAHLSVMERKGIKHIASSDQDFGTMEDITLWSPM